MKVIKETGHILQEYVLFHQNTWQYESSMQPTLILVY